MADTQVLQAPLPRGVFFPEVVSTETLGQSLAGLGDFNGDGLGDLAFGAAPAFFFDLPSSAYLVWGRRDFPKTFDLAFDQGVVRISTAAPTFGTDVYAAGDVDGDGLADAYIFQLFEGSVEEDPRLYLLYGTPDLPSQFDKTEISRSVRGLILTGAPLPNRTLLNPIASLGDFNGDGLRDLAIGDGLFSAPTTRTAW
jgi:hypothetical protein